VSAGLCLGIDPHAALLAEWGTTLEDFGARAVEAAAGVVGWGKPQAAFHEAHGARGFAALESPIERARAAGLRVIVDAKRGDIGSTMQGYADAWLRDGLWRPLIEVDNRSRFSDVLESMRAELSGRWESVTAEGNLYRRLWSEAPVAGESASELEWFKARSRELHEFVVQPGSS